MKMWKNKETSPYEYVKNPLIHGDPNKKSIEQIVELIRNRYTTERLLKVEERPDQFYEWLVESLNHIFHGRDSEFRKNLTYSLIKMIVEDYSKNELNIGTQFFLTAVVHICFDNLKENEESFRELFCEFDADNGEVHAFCRYIVINEIEKYCCCEINSVREWHKDVINSDGEIFEKNPLENGNQFQIIACLWEYGKGKNKDKKLECLKEFLLGSHAGVNSAYRKHRKDLS